jgi:inosose dehydratase
LELVVAIRKEPNLKKNLKMSADASRRKFLSGAGALASAAVLRGVAGATLSSIFGRADGAELPALPQQAGAAAGALYPPMDLSSFDKRIGGLPGAIRFGYASITWGGNDKQAIEDVSSLGFPGIQLRANAVTDYGDKPGELRELLASHHLKFVALSSGNLSIDNPMADEMALHTKNAAFLKSAGGSYLQVICSLPKGRKPVPADYKELGRRLTELGKRIVDMNIQLGMHNHMNSLTERPEETDWVMEASDPHFAKLELDIAHYQQGGGDPVKAIEKYSDRILFMHIKDVVELHAPDAPGATGPVYQFVELGRGTVNLPAVFDELKKVKYRGWAIVELDAVPDKSRTPKECAQISKTYLEEKLGYKI